MDTSKPFFYKSSIAPIEARSTDNSVACYQKHTHEEFSVGIVESGISEYFYSGTTDAIGPGSTVVINPSDVHACNPKGENTWGYKMLYVDAQWLQRLQCDVFDKPSSDFVPFTQAHLTSPQIYNQFKLMFSLLIGNADQLSQEQAIINFFSDLLLLDKNRESTRSKLDHRALLIARDYIADNCEDNIKIDDIAAVAGLSSYYLIHAFRIKFGITPHAYQLAKRINKAKTLLRYGMDISSVAVNLGFVDQSHFHRHFKRMVAATPKQYKDSFVSFP